MNEKEQKLNNAENPKLEDISNVSVSVFDIKSEVIFNGITYNQHIGFDGLLFYCKQIKK
jgi:hypothetical protein